METINQIRGKGSKTISTIDIDNVTVNSDKEIAEVGTNLAKDVPKPQVMSFFSYMLSVICDNHIKRVFESKSLEIMIDDALLWTAQVDHIMKKVNSAINGLKQIGPFVQHAILKSIYKSLIYDHNSIIVLLFGENYPRVLSHQLQKLQNGAARVITQSDYIQSNDILKSLGFVDLATIGIINKGCTKV